ncbi:MAG TPA: SusC/RagA family TonB-linked outer membrane protein, partial [Gemmatimonadales bacterium]|nr:SusC/RagA family TonB-linked outer membrane protein [Gemmatimonadales bacterium]
MPSLGAVSPLRLLRAAGFGVCAIALFAGRALAQDAVVTGTVAGGQGEALGGAIVVIDELSLAVATTVKGTYTLTVPAGRVHGQSVTVSARYIGYAPSSAQLTLNAGTQQQNFTLKWDPFTLNAVVSTGVAERTDAKKLTVSVGHVDAAQLNQTPAVSALGALEGKVAGVRLIQANGSPGSEPSFRLRGATAIATPSSCATEPCASTDAPGPLIIVDGTIMRHGLADINSEDIDHLEVVKGAAASSLYGSDAANGVVQIFTKRGDRLADGQLVVTVRNEYGQSIKPKSIPTALSSPYIIDTAGTYVDANGVTVNNGDFITAAGNFIGTTGLPVIKANGIADVPYNSFGRPVYDAQAQLLTHAPFYTNYVSVGQRRGNTNYNVSFENTKQEGIMILLKGYNRQNFRLNVDQALTPRFDLSVGGFFGKSNNNQVTQGPGAPFFAVTFIEPYINLFAPNADGTPYNAQIPHQLPNASNPVYRLANERITTDRSRITGYGRATYRLFDWLSLEGNYNYDQESSNFTDEVPKNFLDSHGNPTSGSLTKIDSAGRTFNTGVTLTSVRSFQLGSATVRNTTKVAYIYEDQTANSFALAGNGFLVTNTPEFTAIDPTTLVPGSSTINVRNKNYYGITSFDINDRYLFDGLVRRDGSSLFGPDSRYANYFRVSGAYRVSQDMHINGIDEFKLRGSYGTAGLRPVFNAQYETFAYVSGRIQAVTLGNRNLKPAHSGELELGFNLDFLSRFTAEYSYSRKETRDQILLVPLSAAAGFKGQWKNAGTLLANTHELSVGVQLVNKPEFSWQLNVAADRTRNRITALSVAPYLVGPDYAGNNDVTQMFRIAPGQTYGVIYGTKIVRTYAELCQDPTKAPQCVPGGLWAPDSVVVNEDGYLVRKSVYHTQNEKFIAFRDAAGNTSVPIADVNPDFNASFTTTLRFKGFSAYALVDWTQGGHIYNATRQWPFFEYRDRVYDQSSKPAPASCTIVTVGTKQTAQPDCYSSGRKPISYYQAIYNGINPIDF